MPLFWISLAFLGGILLGELLDWSITIWTSLLVFIMCLTLIVIVLKRRYPIIFNRLPSLPESLVPYPVLIGALIFGAVRFQSVQPAWSPSFIAWYNDTGEEFIVEGVLVEPPDVRESYTNLRLRVERLHPAGELLFTNVDGFLLAKVPPGDAWRYGDRLRLEGELVTPPEEEGFSYRQHLSRQGIYAYMPRAGAELLLRGQGNAFYALVYRLRESALRTVHRLFPDPEASLLAGILLGVETGIPEQVQKAFRHTGTAHIIAISGFNITILAGFFVLIFVRLLGGRRRLLAAGLTAVVIAIYTIMVGADAAVVRACIMGGLSLLAALFGRRQDGLNTLAIVAALMALANPNVIWDVGFQLSFMATLGLLLYAEPLTQYFVGLVSGYLPDNITQKLAPPVSEYFLITIAAMLTTLPVTVYHFQQISLVSILANPAILPAQPPVMILGGIAVILGMVSQPLGQLAATIAWPFAAYTIRVVEMFASIPGGVLELGDVAIYWVVLFYALLFGWTFFGTRIRAWYAERTGAEPTFSPVLPAAGLVTLSFLTIVVWQAVWAAPDGRLHITLLDVGSSEAVLIQTPDGRSMLVGGGPSPSRLSDGLGRRLPLLERKLDFLVVAAAGDGHIAALPRTLERFPPESVLWAGTMAGTRSARELRKLLAEQRITVIPAKEGQVFDLGRGAALRVLSSGSRGAVLLAEWGSFHALMPFGLDFDSMEKLQSDRYLSTVSVLLLAESGYAPLNMPEWIARWRPQVVLLSVAADDHDGLPDVEALQSVDGYNLLRTDLHGWIKLSTDGATMYVEVGKK